MKKTILSIMILFFLPLVLASPELQLNPSIINQTLYDGQNGYFLINISNIGNETMSNISFSNLQNVVFSNIPSNLAPNSSATINITISPVVMNTQSIASFYGQTNVTTSPIIRDISITSTGYSPNTITIRQNDSIRWNNIDVIQHSATDLAGSFNYLIQPNQSNQIIFTNIGSTNYYDTVSSFGASITTQSNQIQVLTHDASKDKTLQIITKTTPPPTNLDLQLIPTDATIEYSDLIQGAIYIKNTGLITALSLHFSANWSSFSENDFNLNPSVTRSLNFNISPSITQTNQTNMTYQIPISVTGTNVATTSKIVNVFIKYHDFGASNQNNGTNVIIRTPTFAEIQAMCNAGQVNCPTTNVTTIIYQDKPYNYSFTFEDIQSMINTNRGLLDSWARLENKLTEQDTKITGIQSTTSNATNQISEIKELVIENNKSTEVLHNKVFWLVMFLTIIFVLIVCVGIPVYFYKKYKSKINGYQTW